MKVVRLKVGVSVVKQLLKGGLANADPKGGAPNNNDQQLIASAVFIFDPTRSSGLTRIS